ncbi:hypothetical protein GCM10010178_91050 [Lentzea flava]|uniref:Uncharacterized protein n=1 Tax=Lentzea flava TaxID=103732 RepID=A0ABQ2VIZ8_9PSEU|nr:hypothetical protein [Lentzea flava]GGU86934.1 hypothetical protein GCM10010178_91050 [Lentzea flava]
MLRRIATGVAFALVMVGGMASAAGMAQADSGQTELAASGSLTFVQWWNGAYSMYALSECENTAQGRYPGQYHECRPNRPDNTTQLWVQF